MLNAKNLGLSAGIVFGIIMFLLTVVSMMTGYGTAWFELVMVVYPGYSVSWVGSVIGLVYGFVEGFVCFYLIAWLYNMFNEKI